LPGFVPPYEITKIVRAAGYDPLTRPRREGTTYVVRATNYRGILIRIVVDARTGAIRAVNRIVPGPGPYGAMGMAQPPYGAAYDAPDGPLAGPPPPHAGPGPYGPLPGRPPPYPPPYYDAPPGAGMTPDMVEPMQADLYSFPPPSYAPPSYATPPASAHSHPPAPNGQPTLRSRLPDVAIHETKRQRNDKRAEPAAIKSAPPPSAAVTGPTPPPVTPAIPAAAPPPPAPAAPSSSPPAAAVPAKKPPPLPPIQD
jgi:hypothetical protein